MEVKPAIEKSEVPYGKPADGWRLRVYTIIFEADTRAGRAFDVTLIWVILASLVVVLDSIASIHMRHKVLLETLEWGFTLLFTIEYSQGARLDFPIRP